MNGDRNPRLSGGWQKESTFVSAAKPSVSAASGSIGLWGEKISDGVDGAVRCWASFHSAQPAELYYYMYHVLNLT